MKFIILFLTVVGVRAHAGMADLMCEHGLNTFRFERNAFNISESYQDGAVHGSNRVYESLYRQWTERFETKDNKIVSVTHQIELVDGSSIEMRFAFKKSTIDPEKPYEEFVGGTFRGPFTAEEQIEFDSCTDYSQFDN